MYRRYRIFTYTYTQLYLIKYNTLIFSNKSPHLRPFVYFLSYIFIFIKHFQSTIDNYFNTQGHQLSKRYFILYRKQLNNKTSYLIKIQLQRPSYRNQWQDQTMKLKTWKGSLNLKAIQMARQKTRAPSLLILNILSFAYIESMTGFCAFESQD